MSIIVSAASTQSVTRIDRWFVRPDVDDRGTESAGEVETLALLLVDSFGKMKDRPANMRTRQYSSFRCMLGRETEDCTLASF